MPEPLMAAGLIPGILAGTSGSEVTEPLHVPAQAAGTADEVYVRLSSLAFNAAVGWLAQVTIRHYNEAGTLQNSVSPVLGTSPPPTQSDDKPYRAVTVSWTVAENDYFECSVDEVSGCTPRDLVWQVRAAVAVAAARRRLAQVA